MKLLIALAGCVLSSMVAASGLIKTKSSHHYERFLQERGALRDELEAWKASKAGQIAKQNGYYNNMRLDQVHEATQLEDELQRFFLTKLAIEQAQKTNPDAIFSTDTPFSLMTDEEFADFVGKSYQLQRPTTTTSQTNQTMTIHQDMDPEYEAATASSYDWTTTGCVASVKAQGYCGSCWAFAAIGSLESAVCLRTRQLQLFSEQELTSCQTQMGGCHGGMPSYGLYYVQQAQGICTADTYPYMSGYTQDAGMCNPFMCQRYPVQIRQVTSVQGSEAGYIAALNRQPIAIGVAANNNVWKQYRGGIISSCPTNQPDHAILAVGYGTTTNGIPYFKIKNSWSTEWGEQGFGYLQRGGNTCGVINNDGVYPEVM